MIKEVIFVVDPMCSWCWGFAPVVEEIRKNMGVDCTFSLVVGGLRTKGEMSWDDSSKQYLQGHWEQVEKSTGQPFSTVLLERESFDYDTYPACKAVVTVKELYGMQKSFEYLHTIQEAFYAEGKDITKVSMLEQLVDSVDVEVFRAFYSSKKAHTLMEHDFAKARSMGANAFPSVVVIDEDGHMICHKGYKNMSQIKELLGDTNA